MPGRDVVDAERLARRFLIGRCNPHLIKHHIDSSAEEDGADCYQDCRCQIRSPGFRDELANLHDEAGAAPGILPEQDSTSIAQYLINTAEHHG